MSTCKGCGAEYRTGTIAFLLTDDGLKGARVCAACVKRGVLIVPVLVAPVIETKLSRATAKSLLEPVVKTLKAQLKALRACPPRSTGSVVDDVSAGEFYNGKLEGIENVIATLEAVRA